MARVPDCGLGVGSLVPVSAPNKDVTLARLKVDRDRALCNNTATPLLSLNKSNNFLYSLPRHQHCALLRCIRCSRDGSSIGASSPASPTRPCLSNSSSSRFPYLLDQSPLSIIKYPPLSAAASKGKKEPMVKNKVRVKQDVVWQIAVYPKGTRLACYGRTSAIVSTSTLLFPFTPPRSKTVGFGNTTRIIEI